MTAVSREEAISLSRQLLAERLIACANLHDHVTSLYHWQGEIEHAHETVIIAKTLNGHVERVIARVKQLSSQSTPCVLALPVVGGNPDYIAWLKAEASAP